MSEENQMPDWVKELFEALVSTIEFKGMAYMEGYHSAPDETEWGIDLLEMAPALMEIAEAGPNDGEQVYSIIHNFDLLAVQELFDEVSELSFGFEDDGLPRITIEGTTDGREIVVLIYVLPFEDAEVNAVIE